MDGTLLNKTRREHFDALLKEGTGDTPRLWVLVFLPMMANWYLLQNAKKSLTQSNQLNQIKSIKNTTASGPDGISPGLFKNGDEELIGVLHELVIDL